MRAVLCSTDTRNLNPSNPGFCLHTNPGLRVWKSAGLPGFSGTRVPGLHSLVQIKCFLVVNACTICEHADAAFCLLINVLPYDGILRHVRPTLSLLKIILCSSWSRGHSSSYVWTVRELHFLQNFYDQTTLARIVLPNLHFRKTVLVVPLWCTVFKNKRQTPDS